MCMRPKLSSSVQQTTQTRRPLEPWRCQGPNSDCPLLGGLGWLRAPWISERRAARLSWMEEPVLGLACFFLESSTLSGSPSPFLSFYGGCHCPGWCAYDVVAPLYWHAVLFVLRSLPTFVLSLGLFLKDSRPPPLPSTGNPRGPRTWLGATVSKELRALGTCIGLVRSLVGLSFSRLATRRWRGR